MVDRKTLVFELLENVGKAVLSTTASPWLFLWTTGGWVTGRCSNGWLGGLGHCKQAHRKGRFVLLRVSQEEDMSTLEFSFGAASGCLGGAGQGGTTVRVCCGPRVRESQLLDAEMTCSAAGGQEQGWSQESRPGGTWFLNSGEP